MTTTSDYLTQLEQDREDLVDNLETKGITGLSGDETFTELVPEVLNIPSGGGADLSEYFNNTISENTSSSTNFVFMKKLPVITVDNNVTSLQYLFNKFKLYTELQQNNQYILPKVICGNNVTNMNYMYSASSSSTTATTIDLSGLDTSNVIYMNNFLDNRENIVSLDFSTFDFSKVKEIRQLVSQYTSAPATIDLSNLRGEEVTDARYLVMNNAALTKLDLSNFAPPRTIDARQMFYKCSVLEELYLDKWDLGTYSPSSYMMFSNCGSKLASGTYTKVYVKDQASQNWVLTASNGHPSTWTTDNVIIAGSETDLRNSQTE